MKKFTALALALLMAASMTACGSKQEAAPAPAETPAATEAAAEGDAPAAEAGAFDALDELDLIIASSASSNLATCTLQQELADKAKEATGGKLNIELNWDGILGDDAALTENCISGTIPMVSLMSSALFNYVPEVGVFDCPAVFGSEEEAYEGVHSMIEVLSPKFEEKGLKILSMGFQTFRALSTNKEIAAPADFAGLKIRTLENKYHMGFWNNLGATATPLAFSDLYLSLQQGLVDGQDNTAPAVYSNKFYEVQDYYMAVPVFMNVAAIIINKDLYDSYDPAYQAALTEFADAYTKGAYDNGAKDIADALDQIGDQITVLPVTDEMLDAFKTAAAPIWDDIAGNLGDEIVNQYLATAGITR